MLRLLCIILCLLSTATFAEEPRKIDLTTTIIDLSGIVRDCRKQADNGQCEEKSDLTLGRLCVYALALPDRNINTIEQISRGKLAMRLLDAKEIVLTADEIKLIKDQLGKLGYNSVIVYQAARLLDPAVN